jgi:methionyl-tRNA formyltransferase
VPSTVVVFGKGDLAVRVARWFHDSPNFELIALVPSLPEPDWADSLSDWARAAGVPLIESGNHADLASRHDGLVADLGVSVFFNRIFKVDEICRYGRLINIHNGPLPKYRGMSPINWALKNGETSHGVTIHEITPGIDDGPIISQVNYSIYPEIDEVEDVYARSLKFAWILFEETIPRLNRIAAVPQEETDSLYYSSKDHARLGDRANWRREISQ